jgi:hypothetical protein
MTERTEREKEYDAIVASVVKKPQGHIEVLHPVSDKRLYSVTTVAASPRFGDTTTPAVCTTFRRAQEIVEENEGDIYETSYKLVVIEAFIANVLYGSSVNEQYWYVWEGSVETGKYVAIERPAAYSMISGWGVG